MTNPDKLKDIIASLEAEARVIRDQLAVKTKALDKAKELLAMLRGGGEEVPFTRDVHPKVTRTGKPPRQSYFPTQEAQNVLVRYAEHHKGEYFTVKDATTELLREHVVPRVTSTTTQHVRKLLNMSTQFFERVGVRDQTRYKGK